MFQSSWVPFYSSRHATLLLYKFQVSFSQSATQSACSRFPALTRDGPDMPPRTLPAKVQTLMAGDTSECPLKLIFDFGTKSFRKRLRDDRCRIRNFESHKILPSRHWPPLLQEEGCGERFSSCTNPESVMNPAGRMTSGFFRNCFNHFG